MLGAGTGVEKLNFSISILYTIQGIRSTPLLKDLNKNVGDLDITGVWGVTIISYLLHRLLYNEEVTIDEIIKEVD